MGQNCVLCESCSCGLVAVGRFEPSSWINKSWHGNDSTIRFLHTSIMGARHSWAGQGGVGLDGDLRSAADSSGMPALPLSSPQLHILVQMPY